MSAQLVDRLHSVRLSRRAIVCMYQGVGTRVRGIGHPASLSRHPHPNSKAVDAYVFEFQTHIYILRHDSLPIAPELRVGLLGFRIVDRLFEQ